jgi:hypothetical protein
MSDSRFLSSSVYQPKLRMFYNGNTDVNVIRADASASVAVKDPQSYEQIADVRAAESPTVQLDARKRPQWNKDLSEDVLVSVFLDLTDEAQSDFKLPADVEARSFIKRGNIAVAEVPLVHVDKLAQRGGLRRFLTSAWGSRWSRRDHESPPATWRLRPRTAGA